MWIDKDFSLVESKSDATISWSWQLIEAGAELLTTNYKYKKKTHRFFFYLINEKLYWYFTDILLTAKSLISLEAFSGSIMIVPYILLSKDTGNLGEKTMFNLSHNFLSSYNQTEIILNNNS